MFPNICHQLLSATSYARNQVFESCHFCIKRYLTQTYYLQAKKKGKDTSKDHVKKSDGSGHAQTNEDCPFDDRNIDKKTKVEKFKLDSPTFRIIPAKEKDTEELLTCLKRSFYKDEPLLSALGLAGKVPPEIDDYILGDIDEDLSLVAVGCLLEEVRGFAINVTLTSVRQPRDQELLQKVGPCWRLLLSIWEFLEVESNLTSCFNVNELFEVRFLGTDSEHRGQGIAKALTMQSMQLAKKKGYKVVCMYCTSFFSKKVAQSVGMDPVWTMPWSQYRDEKGFQVVNPIHPHTHVYVMAKKLC